jgi:hypothetical protein
MVGRGLCFNEASAKAVVAAMKAAARRFVAGRAASVALFLYAAFSNEG